MQMTFIILAIIIVAAVLLLSITTTSKAYQYKHTIDPLEDNPNAAITQELEDNKNDTVQKGS